MGAASCSWMAWLKLIQDNLSFPLFVEDWGADEEILLLEVSDDMHSGIGVKLPGADLR